MKLTLVSLGLLLSSTLFLKACSSPNQLAQHITADAIIEQVAEGKNQGMYRNTYRLPLGTRQYPATCEADCYPAHPAVICETPAQNCQYAGPKQAPALNTGFTVQWLGHASFLINSPDGQLYAQRRL